MKSCTKYDLTLTFDFDLEKFTKVKVLKHRLKKTNQNMLGYYAQGIMYCCRQRSRSRLIKGQIRLIGYNFSSNCHRDFNLGSYFSLWKAAKLWPWPLTLTLKSSSIYLSQTSSLVQILVYEKPRQILPWPWPLTLTLKRSPKVKFLKNIKLGKVAKICLGIMHRVTCTVGEVKSQGQGRAKRSNSLNWL